MSAEEIRRQVERFRERLGFKAPELHDDAWAEFAELLAAGDTSLDRASTRELLVELIVRGDGEGTDDGRVLALSCRQLRATLPPAVLNYLPHHDGR